MPRKPAPRKRRRRGTGTVVSEAGVWVAKLNNERLHYFEPGTTYGQAIDWLDAYIVDLRRATSTPDSITFPDLADRWLADKLEGKLSDVHRRNLEVIVRHHLIPAFSGPADEITRAHVLAYCVAKQEGRAPVTGNAKAKQSARVVREKHLQALRAIFNFGMADGLVARNPAAHVKVDKTDQEDTRPPALAPEVVRDLLRELHPRTYRPLYALMFTTGLRPSEALGLRESDYDTARGIFDLKRVMRRVAVQREDGRTVLAPEVRTGGKSPKSMRPIRVGEQVQALMAEHLRELRRIPDPEESGLLFRTHEGRPIRNYGNMSEREWMPAFVTAYLRGVATDRERRAVLERISDERLRLLVTIACEAHGATLHAVRCAKWDDVDLDAGTMQAEHFGESVTIMLRPAHVTVLRAHKARPAPCRNTHGYVFVARNGQPLGMQAGGKQLEQAFSDALPDVDRRPYQTRHTFAAETVRAVAGDVVQAQYRMRHASNTSTTDLYQSIVERERGTPIDVGGVLLVEETDAPPAKLRVAG